MSRYDVIIAGGGVAGLSAAIFLGRAHVSVAIFDRAQSSLYRVSSVNNYLGFPEGIGGARLLELGRRQAERFGAVTSDDEVSAVKPDGRGFAVETSGGSHACEYFILASNKRTDIARSLGLQLGGFQNRFVSVDAGGETAVPKCYAVGRITGLPSQAVVSAGDGARVAIGLIQRIRGTYYVDHDT